MSNASFTSVAEAVLGSVGGPAAFFLAVFAFLAGAILICNALAPARRRPCGSLRVSPRRLPALKSSRRARILKIGDL